MLRRPLALSWLAALAAALLPGPALAAPTVEWVEFRAATTPPSALKLRLARERGETLDPNPVPGTKLRGLLLRPEGNMPPPATHPAVVLMHDCRGILPFQKEWARRLVGWGYVVLLVDSFTTRKATDVCARLYDLWSTEIGGGRVLDAYGAKAYLETLPEVAKGKIAVMGWAYEVMINTVKHPGVYRDLGTRFKAAIAFYPNCLHTGLTEVVSPLLILAAGRDDWAPAENCRRMAGPGREGMAPVRVRLYPEARHGFDDPESGSSRVLETVWNPHRNPPRGATVGFDRAASLDALKRVQAFLARHTGFTPKRGHYGPDAPDGGPEQTEPWVQQHAGRWAVDPDDPGPDLPPTGRSTFDVLFGSSRTATGYDIPFPFAALTARIEEQVEPSRSALPALKQVLIPLGRSLQRDAARPDYFRFPRAVVAVDAEPETGSGRPRLYLKDRLFLGYQRQANVIEVISYNEDAARFEFQVVRDYGPGLTPKVFYASRSICTTCHQNAAPIFSQAPWAETNFNGDIAIKLASLGKSFFGISPYRAGGEAISVDNATDRANLLSVLQVVWRRGCGDGERGARCRGALLTASLQYALSASSHFDIGSRWFRDDLRATLSARWATLWPGGLYVPDPDLPDRNPLLPEERAITAARDPLTTRPPLDIWSHHSAAHLDEIIARLADSLPKADVRRLGRLLFQTTSGADDRVIRAACSVRTARFAGQFRQVGLACEAPLALEGALRREADGLLRGRLRGLRIADGGRFADVRVSGSLKDSADGGLELTLTPLPADGLDHLRLRDGGAVMPMALRWMPRAGARRQPQPAEMEVAVRGDSSALLAALDTLVRRTASGETDVLSAHPFNGPRLTAAVLRALGSQPIPVWRQPPIGLPPPELDPGAPGDPAEQIVSRSRDPGAIGTFRQYCASCHQTADRFPPNFLQGDADHVAGNLSLCAERLYFRLSMWGLPASERPKAAMPPLPALHRLDLTARDWRDGPALAELRDHVATLLASQTGAPPDPDRFLARDYDSLRNCLPDIAN